MTMNYIYRQRYERYLNESDNRFASVDEVKAQAVPVSLEDLKRGKKTAGGFPMLVERDSVWVDPADHLADRQDAHGVDRQLVDAHAQEGLGQGRKRGTEEKDFRFREKTGLQYHLRQHARFFQRPEMELLHGTLPVLSLRE